MRKGWIVGISIASAIGVGIAAGCGVAKASSPALSPQEQVAEQFVRYGLVHHEPSQLKDICTENGMPSNQNGISGGDVYFSETPYGPNGELVNVFLSPSMTTGGQLYEVTVEKNGGKWMVTNYSTDDTYTATTFQQLMKIPQAAALKWTKVNVQ